MLMSGRINDRKSNLRYIIIRRVNHFSTRAVGMLLWACVCITPTISLSFYVSRHPVCLAISQLCSARESSCLFQNQQHHNQHHHQQSTIATTIITVDNLHRIVVSIIVIIIMAIKKTHCIINGIATPSSSLSSSFSYTLITRALNPHRHRRILLPLALLNLPTRYLRPKYHLNVNATFTLVANRHYRYY
jgi:hypothetical protein